VDTRKNVVHNFDPLAAHEEAISIEGLEDLFQWASEVVTDASDPRIRRTREHKLRRDVLGMIQRAKELEAREKYTDEISCLQRRVIALVQSIGEKFEENSALKQIVLTQYIAMSRFAEIQSELKQLQSITWYREEAEAERQELMTALTKLKKERDYLDELLMVTENENTRLSVLYNQSQRELVDIKNRRWWHAFRPLIRAFTNSATTA
jgi:septal ring factor EnvC (AmiA/AmiB activator)